MTEGTAAQGPRDAGHEDARSRAVATFERRFGRSPTHLARAPGRVNLIGEHTDYNDGFVLPMALDRSAWLALDHREADAEALREEHGAEHGEEHGEEHGAEGREERGDEHGEEEGEEQGEEQVEDLDGHPIGDRPDDQLVRLVAADLDEEGTFRLSDLRTAVAPTDDRSRASSWLDYPRGVAWSLLADGHRLKGFDGVIASDVPRGAGLSSSAALELAVAAAFLLAGSGSQPDEAKAGRADWDVGSIARAMQRTENQWIGVSSGIMDQLIGAAAVAGHATLIDCRDLSLTPVPLPEGVKVAILDTGTRRGLVGSAYNERRASCERVAHALGVKALRDLDVGALESATNLDPVDKRRALHVVAENRRTVEAANALANGDVRAAGELMRQSHASLRDLFEVSSPALDAMVAAAEGAPGCFGARMTGAGFGGCAVALVAEEELARFTTATSAAYQASTGREAVVYESSAGPGAAALSLTGNE